MSDNLSFLAGRKGVEKSLFEEIVKESKATGTPSSSKLKELANDFLVGNAVTYGTASFYDFTRKEHEAKKVHVCNGSACMLAGTQESVNNSLKNHFKEDEIGHMCCLGRCHENSAFNLDGANYSGSDIENIDQLLAGPAKSSENHHVEACVENPVFINDFTGLDEYYKTFKNALEAGVNKTLVEIKKSGVRGRGGAGFPMGFKWESCKNTPSEQKFIVCNADEGDPGAYSDRYILERQPHAVLLGMMVAGFIIGANRGVLYIRGEYPESVDIIRKSIELLEDAGLNGENILGSGFDFRFKIIEGAGAYICGEETALLSSIEGQRPEVRVRPPYPTQQGLFNNPTVVNNVETLAAVPWILKNGGEEYAQLGTEKSTGTKLVCLDSFFNRPGMYEVEMGMSLRKVIDELGQGFKTDIKALHIGGPLGGIVPVHKIDELSIDFESFASGGFLLGHASIICVPADYPMVKYLEHLFEFTALESCGKCFPCSIGSIRGQEMLAQAQAGVARIDRTLFEDLLETMEVGSLCALGGGLPLGVKNALEYFDEELKSYFKEVNNG